MKKIYSLALIITMLLLGNINAAGMDSKSVHRTDYIHKIKDANEAKKTKEVCYNFIGKRSQLPVSYVINPANIDGLSESFIVSAISESAETWDRATGKNTFDSYTIDYTATARVLDGKNTLAFGAYQSNAIIALTSVWKTDNGEILETDTLFNTAFIWGDATQNQWVMDVQSIATHELGHSLGLGDVYNPSCSEVTMYSSSGYGEINKRTLEKADISGLKKLYRKR